MAMHNRTILRGFFGLGLALLLAGCVGGYSRYYTPSDGALADLATKRVAPAPENPRLAHASWSGTDPDVDVDWLVNSYAKRGYVLIGSSVFNSGKGQHDTDAVAQAKRVGADLVVVLPPRYTGSVTDVEPVDMVGPSPFYGPGFGPRFGSRFGPPRPFGWGHGWGWGPGWGRRGFYYGPDMVWMPVTVNYNDYAAFYFVKIRWRFGAIYRALDDGERKELGTNKGVSVSVVVDDSPAFGADILVGDVITAVNGQPVSGPEDFGHKIDDPTAKEITLTIRRDDKTITKAVPLAG